MALKFCPNCGKQNTFGSNFCSNCGTNLQEKGNQEFEIVDGVLKKYNGKNPVIHVPNTVRKIGGYAFPCSNYARNGFISFVQKIYLPSSVKELDHGAFSELTALTYVDMPSSLEVIGAYAFQESSIEEITIPSKVTKIQTRTFDHCLNLKKVNLPEGLQEIECDAFRACVKMTSIRLPRSVKRVGSHIFFDTPLRDIYYGGTKQEFTKVFSFSALFYYSYSKIVAVHCSDGTLELKGD